MKKIRRLIALVLCLCLLPVWALAEEQEKVTRSDFSLSVKLHADGFPNDGLMHYQDWERFLDKLSISGVADSQLFLQQYERLYVDGSLNLKGKETVPFEYDNYYNIYRYIRTPALGGASMHFNFYNFFQFMLKPYYYMGLPFNLIALPVYPQSGSIMYNMYAEPIAQAFEGEGSREIDYDTLLALCEELDLIVTEDLHDQAYYFLTCLLIDTGLDWTLPDKLGYLEGILDYLDPEGMGMTITVDEDGETWVLGETTVLEKTVSGDEETLLVSLPDEEGFEIRLAWNAAVDAHELHAQLLQDEAEQLGVRVTIDGLSDPMHMAGNVVLEITGETLPQEVAPIAFAYDCTRSAETLPCDLKLDVDWLHPETGLPAVGIRYAASMQEQLADVLYDRPYDNQDDFFNLNEGFMAEYKERFLPTLVLAAAPFALEMPAGVISDVVKCMDETGFLAFFGLE